MNKKGFIFVLSASILVVVLLIVFLSGNEYNILEKSNSDYKRLVFANDFVKSFNQDLERAIRITSFRSLIALEEHIAMSSSFLEEVEPVFIEVFSNGTINNVSSKIMEDASLQDYLIKVNSIGERFNLEMDVQILSVSINHFDAWNLIVKVNTSVSVVDRSGKAKWEFVEEYDSIVPIIDLRDPLYSVFTNNRLPNSIRTFDDVLVNGTNVSGLIKLINESYYIESNSAPSFLQRFTNDTSSSEFGIQSIVNILIIEDQDVTVFSDRIKIDFIYFNNLPFSEKLCNFQGVTNNFYFILPNSTNILELYQVQNLSYDPCS